MKPFATDRSSARGYPVREAVCAEFFTGDGYVKCPNVGNLRIFWKYPFFAHDRMEMHFLVPVLPDGHPCAKCHAYVDEWSPTTTTPPPHPLPPQRKKTNSRYVNIAYPMGIYTSYHLLGMVAIAAAGESPC